MIKALTAIYAHDTVNEFFVLRDVKQGKLCALQAYEDLVCPKCKKIDEKAALERGVQANVTVKSRRAFLGSADDFYIVNESSKAALLSLFAEEIDFFPIRSSLHFVASAKTWVQPNPLDPGFRFGRDQCSKCGRYREVVWGKVPPQLPSSSRFVAVNLESIQGAREVWLVSGDAAESLRKMKPALSGLVLSPKEVEGMESPGE